MVAFEGVALVLITLDVPICARIYACLDPELSRILQLLWLKLIKMILDGTCPLARL